MLMIVAIFATYQREAAQLAHHDYNLPAVPVEHLRAVVDFKTENETWGGIMREYMQKAKKLRRLAAQRQQERTCSRVFELPWQEDDDLVDVCLIWIFFCY